MSQPNSSILVVKQLQLRETLCWSVKETSSSWVSNLVYFHMEACAIALDRALVISTSGSRSRQFDSNEVEVQCSRMKLRVHIYVAAYT